MATKTKLRALLVGVTKYQKPPNHEGRPVVSAYFETDVPSAALDVLDMIELGESLEKQFKGGVEVLPLIGSALTTRANILEGLEWLGQADGQTQLLFYFAGHGGLARNGAFLDEVLLPSDYDWTTAQGYLTDAAMLERLRPALGKTACLEVAIEACSATHRIDAGAAGAASAPIRTFGCFLAGGATAGLGTVWAACGRQQQSHSGHVGDEAKTTPSPCDTKRGPVRGLFTYFFCRNFKRGIARKDLLDAVTIAIGEYQDQYNDRCCEHELKMADQTPCLYINKAFISAAAMQGSSYGNTLSGDCGSNSGELVKPDTECAAPYTTSWVCKPVEPAAPTAGKPRLQLRQQR